MPPAGDASRGRAHLHSCGEHRDWNTPQPPTGAKRSSPRAHCLSGVWPHEHELVDATTHFSRELPGTAAEEAVRRARDEPDLSSRGSCRHLLAS